MSHETTKARTTRQTRTVRERLFRVFVFSWLIVAAPRAALACPVCFGNSDSPLAIATNMGIIAMLVVVAGMVGAFATFFIYLNRRAKQAAAQERTA
jgi:hypothetical protein